MLYRISTTESPVFAQKVQVTDYLAELNKERKVSLYGLIVRVGFQ